MRHRSSTVATSKILSNISKTMVRSVIQRYANISISQRTEEGSVPIPDSNKYPQNCHQLLLRYPQHCKDNNLESSLSDEDLSDIRRKMWVGYELFQSNDRHIDIHRTVGECEAELNKCDKNKSTHACMTQCCDSDSSIDRTSLMDSWKSILKSKHTKGPCPARLKRQYTDFDFGKLQKQFRLSDPNFSSEFSSFKTRTQDLIKNPCKKCDENTNSGSKFDSHESKLHKIDGLYISSSTADDHNNSDTESEFKAIFGRDRVFPKQFEKCDQSCEEDCTDHVSFSDFCDSDTKPEIRYERDYVDNDDEDCIMGELRRDDYLSKDVLDCTPLQNVFMNHPHYNTSNPDYFNVSLLQYILKYGKNQINPNDNFDKIYRCLTNTTFNIPVPMVDLPIITPDNAFYRTCRC